MLDICSCRRRRLRRLTLATLWVSRRLSIKEERKGGLWKRRRRLAHSTSQGIGPGKPKEVPPRIQGCVDLLEMLAQASPVAVRALPGSA